ncbi:general transcription factor IIE subunit 1 [Biomphalaria glabrata]|uniref:General transcription factor IIE subunit 1 n=1 Tax=Biomphalaria glabrata TaxID=6526 RepID=A0A2C9JKI8_BIOGL|nr:general transcription factor IIE subunit 1 [Biomphalaria glabrata]
MDLDAPLKSVPEELKRLVRLIVRGFYAQEHTVVIDMLVRHPCVKEDDLAELLKFERKHLRSILNMLKIDKFLKTRMRVETDEEGRTTRHTFYFINYSVFVNVVKYKLDHMRRKIEMDERDNTSRSSFKCPQCLKAYTDYEVGELLDPSTGELVCTYCQTTVVEDESSVPTQDARTLLARFNEQIQPIYDLLRVCEDVRLAPEVLEPEPTDMKKLISRNAPTTQKQVDADKTVWSGDSTRNIEFGYSENRVTITMDNENSTKVEKKDQPIWMTKSTIDGSSALDSSAMELKISEPEKRGKNVGADDILQTLLVHEPKAGPSRFNIPDSSGESDNEELKNADDVEEMDSEDEEDGGPMVSIGSSRVPYNSVTSEMVAAMTPLEKEEYIRIGQQLYENMYD